MSGAEGHMPPPPPPPSGAYPHGNAHPMQGEWLHYTRGPNGNHYYHYAHHYKRCGGRWGTGFVVGGLVGMCAASWWQRRDCHGKAGDRSCWDRPWGMNPYYNSNNQQNSQPQTDKHRPEDLTNQ